MAKTNVFISYARADQDFARKLSAELSRKNFSAWLDRNAIEPGENWENALQQALDDSEWFVFLLSATSLSSPNVALELGYALSRAKESNAKLVPVLLDDARLPGALQRFQVLDARHLEPEAVAERIEDVAAARGHRS
jgi:hypothetical protein